MSVVMACVVDGYEDIRLHNIGGQCANIVDTEVADEGVGSACAIGHHPTCLRKLDVIGYPQDHRNWIRVHCGEPDKVQGALDPHKSNILLATVSIVAVDGGQKNGCVAGRGSGVDLITVRPVKR